MLWCRFQQWLGTFTKLVLRGSSEMGLFRHLPNHVFRVRNIGNTKAVRIIFFFSKCSEFYLDFKTEATNSENLFCFWDNCNWIGIVKLSPLGTGYFSSAANVLKSSPKILHVNKRELLRQNFLGSYGQIWSRCWDADFNSSLAHLPSGLSKRSLKIDFLGIYLTAFSKSVIAEIQKLWGHLFFQNVENFRQISKIKKTIGENFFASQIVISELVSLNYLC